MEVDLTKTPIIDAFNSKDHDLSLTVNNYLEAIRLETASRMLPVTSEWHLRKGDSQISISKEAACMIAIEYVDELIKQLKES